MRRLALIGGTVYRDPFEQPLQNAAILIDGGKIAAIGPCRSSDAWDAPRLDCSGCSISAGFWNSHVHFFERKWANAAAIPADELERQLEETFTRFGFTSVFDLGSPWDNTRIIRDRIASGEVRGPAIFSTGEALLPTDAMPPAQVLAALGYVNFPAPQIADAQQAQTAAMDLLRAGVDGIKLFPSSPRGSAIPADAIRAAAHAARSSGKPAFAHPDSKEDIVAAVSAGVNVVAHTTPRSGPWDDALIALMKQHGAALTPTITLWKTLLRHDRIALQDQLVDTAIEQLRAWHTAGGRVLFGTDYGATDADPANEYTYMERAGMSFADILASLTINPRRHFGCTSATLKEGAAADIVVFQALSTVQYVVRAGALMYSAREEPH